MEVKNDAKIGFTGGEQVNPGSPVKSMGDITAEQFFFTLCVIFILSYAIIPLVGHGASISSAVGITSFIIAIVCFLRNYKMHGIKSEEGKTWLLFSVGSAMLIFSRVADASGYTLIYFWIRLSAYPLLVGGFLFKLHMSGVSIRSNEKTLLVITFLGWGLLVFITALVPAFEDGFNYETDMYALFSLAMLFGMMVAYIIILTLDVKGWYYLSLGATFLALGEILHVPAVDYGLDYPGNPISLFWYIGFLFVGYGAHIVRREYLELISP